MKVISKRVFIVLVWITISVGIYKCGVTQQERDNDLGRETEENNKEGKVQPDTQEIPFDENVRVLIMNGGYRGICHTELRVTCDGGVTVNNEDKGSEYVLTANDFKDTSMISLKAKDGGRLQIKNLGRKGNAMYRGTLECYPAEGGIVVINELPVEEYLYSVVPSEMPSTYPAEALKAQAISARTYTYFHKKSYAYPEWRAHMDDSTAFQVYMDCDETPEAVKAVDETRGRVLAYKDGIVESFYYSTSGGYNGGADVWKDFASDGGEGYLVETGEEIFAAPGEEGEQAYRQFIDNGNPDDVEYNEAWYRWKYKRSLDDTSVRKMFEKVYQMSLSNPQKVKIRSKYMASEKIKDENGIRDIRILERKKSGLVTGIMICTENFKISVTSQHMVRQALGCAQSAVTKNDGSSFVMGDILPSAYFYIEKTYGGDNIKQMTIHGAGFGHGCGMSQNGAKGLAGRGLTYEQILAYYYNGSIKDITEIVEGEVRNVGNRGVVQGAEENTRGS